MVVHCNHQAEEDRGNECLKEVIPAKAMRLSGEKVNAYKGINAVDPGQRTIATMWIPTTGAFFPERKKIQGAFTCSESVGLHESRRARLQDDINHISAHPGKTEDLQQSLEFAHA
jgi:hypothetical protein